MIFRQSGEEVEWRDSALALSNARIPSPSLNYNQVFDGNVQRYEKEFVSAACLKELPFLIRSGLSSGSSLLDYGCGFGRLAYAASNWLNPDGAYYGFEPNPDALSFLKQAYNDLPNFHFFGEVLRTEQDYIAVKQGSVRDGGIEADTVDIARAIDRPIDLQWSLSVFTHMWPSAIIHILNQIKRIALTGLCVNSWLIVDDFAAYVLRCGLADRTLPHRINGALTYSLDNPLTCTAYELDTVKDIYRSASHEIVDILWGSWSGRENGISYQDVVISRPL